jgi:HD-GYP domain-containing protein (c-di-GMP phosphodiesterase class II)
LLERDVSLLLSATDREQSFSISTHSVNVSVFAIRFAQVLGRDKVFCYRVGLAALLHEIGAVKLPGKLVYRQEQLSLDDLRLLRQRPHFAARILSGLGADCSWLGEVVGQVFEREDGSGWPLGLSGEEIREEAKLIGIADFFDACIHKRPYRQALTGNQAVYELTTRQTHLFPDSVVKALIKGLSLYPFNEYVLLNTSQVGRVVNINPGNLSRPQLEVYLNEQGNPLREPVMVDLAEHPSLYVKRALKSGDLQTLMREPGGDLPST